MTDPHLRECPYCGRVQLVPALPPRAAARCSRCRQLLRRTRRDPHRRPLAYALAGLALYGAVIALQFMSIRIFGFGHAATLLAFPAQLDASHFWALAVLFLLFILILPPLKLLLLAIVLLALALPRPPPVIRWLFRLHNAIGPWAMVEIFLVGFFVAYTRLVDLANVDIGAAVWALGGLMLATIAADAALDRHTIWEAIERRVPPAYTPHDEDSTRLVACPSCAKVLHPPQHGLGRCSRCAAALWPRKVASVSRTWAMLIAACICAIGAYAYPVMTVSRFGFGSPTTIFAGMMELFAIGWWPIGIIVFIASITIPMFKLVALAAMLVSVHRRSATGLRSRTRIYRFVEQIGRWSMIDIFMVSILTALVQLGFFARVEPDLGAVAFAAVVILTMFAAYSFDPRLMWDAAARSDAPPHNIVAPGTAGLHQS